MEVFEKELYFYQSEAGRIPFEEWLLGLDDARARDLVRARLARLRAGSFGDCKFIGDGIYEMRLFYGAGLRIYFASLSDDALLILLGGDKSRQQRDIHKARDYWKNYRRRT